MTIQKTKDYSKFKRFSSNRRIIRSHLKNLIVSISQQNLLPENPIIVNEKMEIVDGQHRLEAAKMLKIDIYYIVKSGASTEDVRLLNQALKPWFMSDYVRLYEVSGNKNYTILREFCEKNSIPLGRAMGWLTGVHHNRNNIIQGFREGKFEVTTIEDAELLAIELDHYRKYFEELSRQDDGFFSMVAYMHDKKPVSHVGMLEKLQQHGEGGKKIPRQAGMREYLRALEDIFNKYARTPVRFF